jgi:hypothetical protein
MAAPFATVWPHEHVQLPALSSEVHFAQRLQRGNPDVREFDVHTHCGIDLAVRCCASVWWFNRTWGGVYRLPSGDGIRMLTALSKTC